MSRTHSIVPLLVLAALAFVLSVAGSAAAQTQVRSKYGGTLVVGVSAGDAASLDPTMSQGTAAVEILRSMCLRLYDTNGMQPVPVLAAAPPVMSKDKLSYTVQLRAEVQFNDGTPFNAQAVVASYQRYLTYPGSTHASDFASVDTITASGPYTVVYRLKARDSTFTGDMYVLSPTALARLGDNFASNPICVGPFMFDHRVPGDNVTVVKSPYYYDKGGVYLDKIVYKPITDAAAAAAALKAGDIQVLDKVSATELDGVRQTSSLRVLTAPQLGWRGIFINIGNSNGAGNPPYTNKGTPLATSAKLRQAFEEAIDRSTLNRVVFGGIQQVSCTPIAPEDSAWFEATTVPCTPYDPKDAKKLVAASGFSNPTVHLMTLNSTDGLRLAQFIQAQEAAVGINVVIDSMDSPTSLSRAVSGNYDAYIGLWSPGSADPNGNIYPFLTSSGARNYSGYSSPRLDLILANGLKATGIKARSTLYHAALQIIQDDRPLIYIFNPVTVTAYNTSVTGVRLTPSGAVTVANAQFR